MEMGLASLSVQRIKACTWQLRWSSTSFLIIVMIMSTLTNRVVHQLYPSAHELFSHINKGDISQIWVPVETIKFDNR